MKYKNIYLLLFVCFFLFVFRTAVPFFKYPFILIYITIIVYSVYKYKYDYIIIGHTHLPKLIVEDDYIYINCGDWVHNKTYAIYEDGDFRLVEVQNVV